MSREVEVLDEADGDAGDPHLAAGLAGTLIIWTQAGRRLRRLGRLLREPSFSIAADEVKRENAAQPSLFEVVRRLESLV